MRKIIDGITYDTATATPLATYQNGNRDLGAHVAELLFRQEAAGRYFLYARGGNRSAYAVQRGRYSVGGEEIEALTEEQARAWCERRLRPDAPRPAALFQTSA